MSRNQLRCYHECRNSKVLAQYPEPFHRMHLVVDFVAGMTDTYALKIFRILSGITTSVRDQ
jgi:dGTP triphosphohydrolase